MFDWLIDKSASKHAEQGILIFLLGNFLFPCGLTVNLGTKKTLFSIYRMHRWFRWIEKCGLLQVQLGKEAASHLSSTIPKYFVCFVDQKYLQGKVWLLQPSVLQQWTDAFKVQESVLNDSIWSCAVQREDGTQDLVTRTSRFSSKPKNDLFIVKKTHRQLK